MSKGITVQLPDSKSFKLPNGVDDMIEYARGTGHSKFKNQLVPSLWVPVFRHLFQTRFAGNHVGVVLDSTDKDSVESLLKEVYPLFGEAKNKNTRLRKYYSSSEDVFLNQVTEPSNKGETRQYTAITFNQQGQTSGAPITTNPLAASVHNTEPIEGVPIDSKPSFEKLVYGYNAMARKILSGDAKERPGPFTGVSLDSGDYIGNLDKPHPVVGEISSWMAGQASEDNPSELYRWVTEHAFSKDNADSRTTMKNVAADLLEMVGTQDRWYPGIDMQDPKDIVDRWVKSAARVGPEIGAAVVETPSVKGITVEEYKDAVLTDNIVRKLDVEQYKHIIGTTARILKRWLNNATPPDDILDRTTVQSSKVPLVRYNQKVILSLLQSIGKLNNVTESERICRKAALGYNEKLKKQRLTISDLKREMKLLKERQTTDTDAGIESELQKKLDEVTVGSKISQQESLYNEHFVDSPEKVMPHNLSPEETDNHFQTHSQSCTNGMLDKSVSTFHSKDH
jgi:hypothetical protein